MGWQWRQLCHHLHLAPDKNYASTSSLDALPDTQPTVSSTEGHENSFWSLQFLEVVQGTPQSISDLIATVAYLKYNKLCIFNLVGFSVHIYALWC